MKLAQMDLGDLLMMRRQNIDEGRRETDPVHRAMCAAFVDEIDVELARRNDLPFSPDSSLREWRKPGETR